ncbi:hypothetical protein [Helicobacter sp.]|uniref:hypothetical protein n=1 Tax=Helicobacter sp. TaxID=218 RepID=UPI0025C699A3|nr:hypothetical protein [Helicobacter sp.]MCI5968224.1 hypothetical protein [Helicobacter sp.]MDY2584920.1 hypothetical protein [Helicobacter sp.]
MEDFEKLQNIGAKEISKNTHIALNKVQYILERNYKELRDSATTHGLLQILEREYRINLKEWEEEYRAFWESYDSSNDEVGPMVNFKVTHETIATNDSKRGVILGVLLVLLLGVGFFAFMNFYGSSVVSDENTEAQNEVSLEKLESKMEMDKDSTEENNATSDLEATNPLDASAAVPMKPQESKDAQQAESKNTDAKVLMDVQNSEVGLQGALVQESAERKKVSIVPARNVWVGIVYLDSKKKTSFIAEDIFEVNLERPQTIVTGHGMLEIDAKGEKSAFNSANRMFFIVDEEGNFLQATQRQYETETRGLGW